MSVKGRVSGWARPKVLVVAAVVTATATAAAAGLVSALPGPTGHRAVSASPSTTVAPSLPTLFDEPSTTDTTIAEPTGTEPADPATPTPAPATPVLTANSIAAPVFYRLHLSTPVVFVTIDDGWVRDPRVITFLKQTGWPVSAFLIERAAVKDPGYFRQLSAAGATIEDHTYDHPYLTSLTAGHQSGEICRPERDYGTLLGHTPTLLRPPYGKWNATTQNVAHACGLAAVVEWSATMSAGRLAVAGPRLRGGDIILLHFTPTLYSDLVTLRSILAADGLSVGRLESYLTAAMPAAPSATSLSTTPKATTTSSVPTIEVPSTSTTSTTTTSPPTST